MAIQPTVSICDCAVSLSCQYSNYIIYIYIHTCLYMLVIVSVRMRLDRSRYILNRREGLVNEIKRFLFRFLSRSSACSMISWALTLTCFNPSMLTFHPQEKKYLYPSVSILNTFPSTVCLGFCESHSNHSLSRNAPF